MKVRSLVLASTLLLASACINPYACKAEYRFAEFKEYSVWNGYPQAFSGPGSWDEFWDTLEAGNGYLEIHPADGLPPVRGRLTPANSRGFQPSCT